MLERPRLWRDDLAIASISSEHFPFIGGRSYREAGHFARVVAEVVSRQLGCGSEASFAELDKEIRLAVARTFERLNSHREAGLANAALQLAERSAGLARIYLSGRSVRRVRKIRHS